ncbi:MAG: hypothetical protein ACRERU_20990 [Methylococcales bacterium]
MNYPDKQLERWAAYASILGLPIGILGLFVSVLGIWESYIAPYITRTAPPPVPDGPFQHDPGSELGYINEEYMGLKRFWGDDALGNLLANFFSTPSLWIPAALVLLLTYFVLRRVRTKRSIEKMKE